MATGQFGSTASPTKILGMLVQAQARFRVGTETTWGALETTSATYTAYSAPIGLANGKAIDMGVLASLGINISAPPEPFDAVNERQPSIYIVPNETCEITAGITQFNHAVMELMLHHGVKYDLDSAPNNEVLFTFGTTCAIKSRPIQIDATNLGCFLPAGQDVDLGITAIILTIYDAISMNGLTWGDVNAKSLNVLDTTWMGRPLEGQANGNTVGNLYCF